MEGYYPIGEYARLAGVTKDAAYHRAYRGKVKSKWKNERLLIHYDPEDEEVPDGFVSVKEWSSLHYVGSEAARAAIRKKRFREEDMRRVGKRVYLRAGADYERDTGGHIDAYCMKICPEGYLPCREWAKRNGMRPLTVSEYVWKGRIPSVRVGNYHFVREDYKYRRRGEANGRGCTDGAGGGRGDAGGDGAGHRAG